MECLSKHTKDATALRGSYKFKSAEVATIMVAAGYAVGVAGRAFLWEYLYVQGRQLATAELNPERVARDVDIVLRQRLPWATQLQSNSGQLGYL